MKHDELKEVAPDILSQDRYSAKDERRFGPSQVSGCPLKVFLNEMTDNEVVMNSYMFAGKAVHYYLQETGILREALVEAGYHPAFIEYEQTREYEVQDGIYIHGSCDVLAEDQEDTVVYDMKFTSLPADSGHGRFYKYFSQAHTYARMWDADGYGLIVINSRESDDLSEAITIMDGEMSEENWELVQQKVVNICQSMEEAGYYEGERFDPAVLRDKPKEFWMEVIENFDTQRIPSYEGECKYCDHKDYCPDYNGDLGGLNALVD